MNNQEMRKVYQKPGYTEKCDIHINSSSINLFQSKLEKLAGFVAFFIFSLISSAVFAQAASFNYDTQTGALGATYSWINCSTGTTIITGDDAQGTFSWPFNFTFYDNTYTTANSLSVATNGFIRLDGTANTDYAIASAYTLSSGSIELGQIIATSVSDCNVGRVASSWVKYLVTGSAPDRILTVEYNDIEISYNDGRYADVQVSFYETSNKVVLKFGADNVTAADADMGIHSGVSGYFNKWQEIASGTNNSWIEYIPTSTPTPPAGPAATWNYSTLTGTTGTTYSWIDCSAGASIVSGDDARANISWPFNFNFYDNSYTTSNSLSVSTNGFIRLDGTATTDYNAASTYSLTGTAANLGQIITMGVFDGKIGDNGGWIRSLVTGTAPNRIFTIEYKNLEIDYNSGRYANIQVSFYETLNKIVLKFGTDNVTQAGADIGIHSGISDYFNKWQEVANGTNNTWFEYTPPYIEVNATIGTSVAFYPTLKNAFDKINDGSHKGNVTIKINHSTTESSSAILNASGAGSASYSSVNIYPTETGLSISGDLAEPLISLNGADNITIDGRVNATGSIADLTIFNSNASGTSNTSTIRFINSATNNNTQYCTIKGAATGSYSGVLLFAGSNAGSGNNGNRVENCSLTGLNASERPYAVIYSYGTAGRENSNNIISNNNILDFLKPDATSYGIYIYQFSTDWTLTGNSFFETADFAPTANASFYAIRVLNTLGNNFSIHNNFMGGRAALCGGSAWKMSTLMSARFYAIHLDVGTATPSSVQGNTIKNLNITNSNSIPWMGIDANSGAVNIGTVSGNTIGAATGNGSVSVTNSNTASSAVSYGIYINSPETVVISNNTIGSVTVNSVNPIAHSFYGIYKAGNLTGDLTVSNNLIGSLTTTNSIQASTINTSSTAQYIYGIMSSATGTNVISSNIVANLFDAHAYQYATNGQVIGIYTSKGINTIQNNTVRDLSCTSPSGDAVGNAAVIGISQQSITGDQTISGNSVYALSSTYTGSRSVNVTGIYYYGGTTGTNAISGNFIHTLDASTASASLTGIKVYAGTTTTANNIISLGLGVSTGLTINGLYENGNSGNDNNMWFNTVYIGGTVSGTTSSTYALYSVTNNNARDFRNNVLFNARTGGSTGNHYAIRIGGITNVTIDYNDYFISGSPANIGQIGIQNKTTFSDWQLGTGQDAHSLNINPNFTTPGGTNVSDYITASTLPGVSGTGILTDYEGITRNSSPKMGALESSLGFIWQGDTSTDFANADNWQNGVVPPDGADISFAATPTNDCYLDQNRTLKDITNTSAKKLIVNGKQLTLTGSIISVTANQIDATAASSLVIFAGTSVQSISAGVFVSNTIDGLTVNNSNGLTQNGNITIQTNITLTNGAYTIGANTLSLNGSITKTTGTLTGGSSSNIIIGGSGASTDLPSVILNNLSLNRNNGIKLSGNVAVGGTLALTAGTLTVDANTLTIAGNAPTVTIGNIDASNASASLEFTNSTGITLPASVFSGTINNLTINGGGITVNDDISVNGILNLLSANPSAIKGSLDMITNTLNMGSNATTVGIGDVTGIIKRQHTFIGNIQYSFGNQYTTLTFINTGTKPGWVSCKVSIGTEPDWRSTAVKREYNFAKDAGDDKAIINLHYLDSELSSGEPDESKLVLWDHHNLPTPNYVTEPHGKSNNNETNNWIGISGMSINYIAPSATLGDKPWGLAYSNAIKIIWTGLGNNGDWSSASNWNGGVPTLADDVLIPAGLTTPYPYTNLNPGTMPAVAKTIEIEAGASITVDSYDITLYGNTGAWLNNGIFEPGTGSVIFASGSTSRVMSIEGTTNFNNLIVNANTYIQPTSGSIIRIGGTLIAGSGSILDFVATSNTIEYSGSSQTVINPIGPGTDTGYHKLILSGSGTKTMPPTALIIIDELKLMGTVTVTAASEITIGNELEILEGSTFATGNYDHTVGGPFDNRGTFIASSGTNITLNGTTVQNIYGTTQTSFEKLTINNAAGVDIFTDITVNDELTMANGNLNVCTTTLTLNGVVTKTSGFLNVNTSSSLIFGGTSALSLSGDLFATVPDINNLTINRTGGVTFGNDIKVNGILHLQSANPTEFIGSLEMEDNTLTMGENATTTGIGDVTGRIKRTTILPNAEYTFGNEFSSVTFPNIGTLPTQITLKVSIGAVPTWKTDGIKRVYDISQIGGSGTRAIIKSHYLDSELNGNNENNLSFFGYVFPTTTLLDRGLTEINTTENWITLSNADFGNLPQDFGVIEHGFGVSSSEVITWDGTESTDWFDPYNWTPAFAPSILKVVIIPDAATTPNDPLITANSSSIVKTVNIQSGGILNAGANSQLTVNGASGAWINSGTFNASTGKVIFNHGVLADIVTVSGTTDFYNIEVGPNTVMQPVAGNVLRIAGVGSADATSVVDFSTINNTVEWNGTDQFIVNPIGFSGNTGYYNLILSGSGAKTIQNTAMIIQGDFTVSGTTTVNATAAIAINGTTKIESGSIFNTGNYNHILMGNFQNDGIFTASSGNSISFSGSISQTLSGSSTTDFHILIVDNTAGVFQSSVVNVNSTFQLNNGNFTVGNTTLSINGSVTQTAGYLSVSSISSIIFGGSTTLILRNNLFGTTPTLNNLTINRAGGVTLGNQSITINGVLDLISGTLTIGANTLSLAGISPTRTNGSINAENASATLVFANSAPVTLPGSILNGNVNNLTVNGAGGITAGSDITINNILNLQSANPTAIKGSLDMDSFTLNMGADATTTGTGDVTGIVKREHTFLDGIEYSFGNQFTNLNFLGVTGSTKPNWISCKIEIGTAPSWRVEAINRFYSFAQSGGNDRMIVKLHYLDSELHDSENDETELVFWDAYDPALTPINFVLTYPRNHNDYDVTNNWVELVGPAINYLATSATLDVKQWGLSYSNITTHKWIGLGSVSYPGDWSLPGHWEGGVPHEGDDVLIPATLPTGNSGYPYRNLLPVISPAKANSVEIESGAVLNSNGYNITVSGSGNAWINNGTFTAGSGTIIFNHGDVNEVVNLNGTTSFNNLTVNSKTFLQAASGSITRIGGTFDVESDSKLDFTSNANTVEYNGSATQNIVNQPAESAAGYYHLLFSGSGTKTLSPNELKIYGNLTTNAAVSATGNTLIFNGVAAQSITGTSSPTINNLTISNSTSPVTSAIDLTCSGNFTNSGDFDMTSAALEVAGSVTNTGTVKTASVSASPLPSGKTWGGTVQYYNSTGNQTAIDGTFNNLTFSNISGTQTATGNLTVNGALTTTSGGFLNMGTYQLAGTLSTINNGGTIQTQNTSATPIPTGKSWGGAVQYNALAGGQTVMDGSYNILTLSNTGGTQTASGDISATTFNTTSSGTVNMGTNALTVTNLTHLGILRTQNTSSTPFTAGLTWGGTVVFDGTVGQTMPSSTFNNLTISNTAGVTAATNQTVNGVLNLSVANPDATHGSLDMATFTLNLGANANTIGIGDVTGTITRISFTTNTIYTYGNANQYVFFPAISGQTLPTSFSLRVTLLATAPDWVANSTKRLYEIAQTGGADTKAIFRANYLDSELASGVDESLLSFWQNVFPFGGANILERGWSDYNSQENWISFSDANFGAIPDDLGYFMIAIAPTQFEIRTWNGSQGTTNWNTPTNWTPQGVPSSSLGIIIPDVINSNNYSPDLPVDATGKYIIIQNNGILNAATDAAFTLSGNGNVWSTESGGLFNPGNSNVTFDGDISSGVVAIAGNTDFYDLTIAASTTLRPGVNSYIGISNAITNNGILDAAATHNTIEFKNSDYSITNPNGETPGFHTLIISGTGTKTLPATLDIWHDFINNGTIDAGTGIVKINGNYILQNIGGTSETNFYDLTIDNTSGTITTTANITASNSLNISAGAILQPGTTNIVGGAGTLTGSGTAKVTGLAAINSFCTQYPDITKDLTNLTVDYNGAGNQTVCAENYGHLIISPNGTRTVTLAGSGTIGVSGVFDPDLTVTDYIVTGSTMNSNGTGSQTVPAFNYYNTIVSGNRGGGTITLANNGIIGIAGHSSVTATNANFVIANSTIDFNGSGDQSIDPFTFWNVIFSGGGSKTTSGDLAVIQSFTVESGVTLDMSSSTLSGTFNGGIDNSGTIKTASTSATPLPSGKNWGGIVEYNGSTAQTVVASTFNNLTLSGAGGATAVADLTVNGTLNLSNANPSSTQGILHTDSYILNMGESATTIGTGDVTGIVKREHAFLNGVEYSFGNQYTTINFIGLEGAVKPTWVSCKIEIGTAPVWRTENVKRIYSFLQAGGTDRTYTKLHYLDSELNSSETDESKIIMYTDKDGLSTGNNTVSIGKSSNNSSDNWVELLGMAINQIATSSTTFTKAYGLGYTNVSKITWTGLGAALYPGDWSLPGNWLGGVPTATDDVVIPAGLSTAYPFRNLLSSISPAHVKTLEIEAGATINANDFNITVSGDASAWVNNGTFDAGTGTVIFNNGNSSNAATIAGITNFYNLTVSDNTKIQTAVGSNTGIGGLFSIGAGSILDFSSNVNTVIYNGNSSQNILSPNGGAIPGYYHLRLSSGGTKTFPASTLKILGDLTINAEVITAGNTTIMSGSVLQTISGSNATEFNNLTIDNANVVSLNMDQLTKILGTLQINIGKKMEIAASNKLTVIGSVINNGGNDGLTLLSSSAGSASLLHNTNGVAATVERYIGGAAENWHFLSSPVSNQTIAGSSWVPSGTYGNGTGYDLYAWDEPALCWVYQLNSTVVPNWPTVHPSANFVPGRGYLYSVQAANTTKAFSGDLNNGTVSYGLTADGSTDLNLQGFNLVGNPYPSSIDWMASKGWTRGNLVTSGGGNDMWIWNPEAENYGVYNSADATGVGTNAVTRYIPAMQGFFVRAQTAGNLETTNDVRVHDATTLWKNGQIEPNRFIAVVSSETDNTFDEVRLLFGYPENKAGAAKLFSPVTTAPSLYLAEGEADFTIRYLSDTIANPHVPLLFKAGRDGYYTINFDFDIYDFDIAILEDRMTGEFTDLTLEPEYRFRASKSDNENRFIIHFGAIPANSSMELPANIYNSGGELVIDLTLVNEPAEVKVVDVLGRTILQKSLNGNTIHRLPLNAKSQVFIVFAQTKNQSISKKVFVY
jgi:hypothetical protein